VGEVEVERFRGSDEVHVLEAEEKRGEDGLTSRANVLEVRVEMKLIILYHYQQSGPDSSFLRHSSPPFIALSLPPPSYPPLPPRRLIPVLLPLPI